MEAAFQNIRHKRRINAVNRPAARKRQQRLPGEQRVKDAVDRLMLDTVLAVEIEQIGKPCAAAAAIG